MKRLVNWIENKGKDLYKMIDLGETLSLELNVIETNRFFRQKDQVRNKIGSQCDLEIAKRWSILQKV